MIGCLAFRVCSVSPVSTWLIHGRQYLHPLPYSLLIYPPSSPYVLSFRLIRDRVFLVIILVKNPLGKSPLLSVADRSDTDIIPPLPFVSSPHDF